MESALKLVRAASLMAIKGYRYFLGPYLPTACRFYPSCSTYALEAINRHGVGRGITYAVLRVARCHPWSAGGVDLVPCSNPHTHQP